MTLPLIITALFGISLAWLVRLIALAPEGYELPGIGFRYGRQPFDDAGCDGSNSHRLTPVSLSLHSQPTSREGQAHHAS